MLNGNLSLCFGEVILGFLWHSVCTCPVPLIKRTCDIQLQYWKQKAPVEGSPLDSPAYLSTQHSHASVSETFAFTPDIFTHVSISWMQYPVWNYERDWIFFSDVDHFVCLFILGWAGSWLLHTGVCLDAVCGLLTVVASPAVERSLEGEGFRVCAHGLRCCTARGIRQDRGSSSCPLHRQGDSPPLCHQGSLM